PRRLFIALVAVAVLLPACSKKRQAEGPDSNDSKPDFGPPPRFGGPGEPIAQPPGSAPTASKPVSPWAATAIPFDSRKGVTFGPPGCPVLIVGPSVYDAKTYKPIRQLSEEYEGRALKALTA